mmetsp:Transcript_14868/g.26441  ORF Transcript_14868/g.26441 Transcript_14868/m.26441 type:complete len:94 (-) Transcript_14868:748-1029(-)
MLLLLGIYIRVLGCIAQRSRSVLPLEVRSACALRAFVSPALSGGRGMRGSVFSPAVSCCATITPTLVLALVPPTARAAMTVAEDVQSDCLTLT